MSNSEKKIIVGEFGGVKWIGTNQGGTGKLLFKLEESEKIFDELMTARRKMTQIRLLLESEHLDIVERILKVVNDESNA